VLLESLLRNLISNALRYTVHGHVGLACSERAGLVRIEVEDTGVGIPPSRHAEIFREFHQLENPERDADKGLGLGLAIVDRLAHLLDHQVEVRSAPGRGSCFSVVLPVASRPDAEEATWPPPEPALDHDLAGMLVLVIDDQAAALESMDVLLRQWGCETLLADSEEQALAVTLQATRPPELIVADYRLRSDRTGHQAIERLRGELRRPIPALIITGDTAPERLREANAGGETLMSKPVAPGRLRAFLRSVRRRSLTG
jgi:CheY-like chemotaxis protein/anti-sigma regulatory factor (Ser/Thr protein kinase)